MKMYGTKALLVVMASGMLLSCANDSKETTIETDEIVFKKEGELDLLKDGEIIKSLDIEIAESPYEWETGLMYRESLQEDQGMLFVYSAEAQRSFYMKNTLIPLDIIFFNKDSVAVSFQENAIPGDETPLPSGVPAQFILEVNAGKVQEWNLEEGDKMKFTRD